MEQKKRKTRLVSTIHFRINKFIALHICIILFFILLLRTLDYDQIKYTHFVYKMEKPSVKLPISATQEFLAQYDRASSYYYPYKVSQVELDKLREIYERYQGYAGYEGGIDKKELMRNRYHHLHLFLLDHMPDIYKDINSSLYGGQKHKRSSSQRKNKTSKRTYSKRKTMKSKRAHKK